ncbi:glucose-1-phosphate thymidylyltransferase [Microbulbifer agarilyticus]|uniref:Glucose-1-phosphate thymidylyltransferase n=1 Tax=Microbulbifer agarilyticus TaxID=260552 RepID=A0A1Q2M7F2_9GAMM|nr:DUF4389 domain-containing protein [Microbulbifer agarilyticus]AQQ68227.1 glucose-1-phosphate thymidylyltransferase [Microbulbifer agarilyticus]
MSNEELKQNLTSTNQWLRLIYMVLFAVLLEIAGFVMLAVVIAQFLFAIVSGKANDNLRRLGDQISSYIYQTLQFLIYNTEEKPFPFSEWPESEEEDLSTYESAEEIDGEVIAVADAEADASTESDEVPADAEEKTVTATEAKKPKTRTKASTASSEGQAAEADEPVIQLGADSDSAADTAAKDAANAHRKENSADEK